MGIKAGTGTGTGAGIGIGIGEGETEKFKTGKKTSRRMFFTKVSPSIVCILEKLEKRKMDFNTNENMVKNGILDIPLWEEWRNQTVEVDMPDPTKKRVIPKFLGASVAGAICGLCGSHEAPWRCYSSPTKEWMKMTGRCAKDSYNQNMARGHRQEPLIADKFEEETGIKVHVTGGWEKKGTWMGVSPDRLIKSGPSLPSTTDQLQGQNQDKKTKKGSKKTVPLPAIRGGIKDVLDGLTTGVVEIKSSKVNGPKIEWICQIIYQMSVVNVDHGFLVVCDLEGERNFQVYKVHFSEKWWRWMKVRLDYFYQCLLDDVEPRLLRYIKSEMMTATKNTKCEFGKTYPPLNDLKIETIMIKKV